MLYARGVRINFRDGSFDWKLKVLFTFIRIIKSNRRVSTPPCVFPNIHPIKTLR